MNQKKKYYIVLYCCIFSNLYLFNILDIISMRYSIILCLGFIICA